MTKGKIPQEEGHGQQKSCPSLMNPVNTQQCISYINGKLEMEKDLNWLKPEGFVVFGQCVILGGNGKRRDLKFILSRRRKMVIKIMMEKGILPNPYEITEEDFKSHWRIDLGGSFGFVKSFDVGKRVYLRDGILQMENDVQMAERKDRDSRLSRIYDNKSNLRLSK